MLTEPMMIRDHDAVTAIYKAIHARVLSRPLLWPHTLAEFKNHQHVLCVDKAFAVIKQFSALDARVFLAIYSPHFGTPYDSAWLLDVDHSTCWFSPFQYPVSPHLLRIEQTGRDQWDVCAPGLDETERFTEALWIARILGGLGGDVHERR